MTPLRQRVIEDMQVRNLSPRTIDCYVRQVALFARHFKRSPELLGLDEIRAYQLQLVHDRKLAWSSFNQAVCARRFLYLKTLGKDWNIDHIPFAKRPTKLPLVLSQDQVRAVLEAITHPQQRFIVMTLYAAGLRVSEAVSLRIADSSVPGLRVSPAQQRVMGDLAACRTAKLGGHVDASDACGELRVSYNSCRNRHCPKCQAHRRATWLEDRCEDLLPVPYFHVVFTLPAELAPLALQNKREIYGALFATAAATLKTIAADQQHLGAEIGFIAVLHTWGQTLLHHPHLHCVVPGGGLCHPTVPTGYPAETGFPSRSGSSRASSEARCSPRCRKASLPVVSNSTAPLLTWRIPVCEQLRGKDWVVYAKPPFGGPEQVLKYLARYTHRVAIANRRITGVDSDSVSFRYKDYARGNRNRVMKLEPVEFLRRFLQHVLPDRFVRIRHYGVLANRPRNQKVILCRQPSSQIWSAPPRTTPEAVRRPVPRPADAGPAAVLGEDLGLTVTVEWPTVP